MELIHALSLHTWMNTDRKRLQIEDNYLHNPILTFLVYLYGVYEIKILFHPV